MRFGPNHQQLQKLPGHSVDFCPDRLVEVSLQLQAVLPFLFIHCAYCVQDHLVLHLKTSAPTREQLTACASSCQDVWDGVQSSAQIPHSKPNLKR